MDAKALEAFNEISQMDHIRMWWPAVYLGLVPVYVCVDGGAEAMLITGRGPGMTYALRLVQALWSAFIAVVTTLGYEGRTEAGIGIATGWPVISPNPSECTREYTGS